MPEVEVWSRRAEEQGGAGQGWHRHLDPAPGPGDPDLRHLWNVPPHGHGIFQRECLSSFCALKNPVQSITQRQSCVATRATVLFSRNKPCMRTGATLHCVPFKSFLNEYLVKRQEMEILEEFLTKYSDFSQKLQL